MKDEAQLELQAVKAQGRAPLLSRKLTLALWGIGALMLLASPLWGPRVLAHSRFFRVRRVVIEGTRYLQPSDILQRLNVDTMASVWDPAGPLERRVAEHPQVQEVHVRRRLPSTLVVEITEHLPVALVPAVGGFRAYDDRGVALPIDPATTPVDAPILLQRDDVILRLLGRLRIGAPKLYDRISAVRRVEGNELLFTLATLPVRAMADVTVDRLTELYPVEQDLAQRHLAVAELDLRFRDQVIARLP
ncbi:MAG: ftsQ [Gemmatimonadetes bacterium]|nr:ftsQ [Gemmatimonadota bacterium]